MSDRSPVSLVDQAYELLRSEILDCTIAPGSQVTERSLASSYGFGLSAVRSALVRLASENLLTAVPRVGYTVAPITLRGVGEFFEAWEILGPALVRLAAARMTDEQREQLMSHKVPGANATPQELVAYATATWDIVVDAADNAVLADLYRRLAGDMYRIFTLVWRSDTRSTMQSLGMPPMLSSTPEEAEQLTRAYIRESRARVTEFLLASTSLAHTSVSFPF
ncbi:GntR family transcriptional regulator [Microbacterium thalassium]|uniref:DNA-binding GntR family transcriptional regulator n=1 Tax=Microbacterium thalassium TaxID=362649 RepID=A0A7X0FMK6_9MICO|nr:GntR family transcriptional regulator [Microbacterium thalassium]MBB6390194.1 DNA-binding GntR family transcriptional regulator [Microbacterium thalassium]GLK25302.1 hypothetical protein GCM10017607_26210 [Microbacterium thalassium]